MPCTLLRITGSVPRTSPSRLVACDLAPNPGPRLRDAVSAQELMRLKKRFMKLDKDGSGSIDRDEFLQIPQIANNPLAHRMIAIFDEE